MDIKRKIKQTAEILGIQKLPVNLPFIKFQLSCIKIRELS